MITLIGQNDDLAAANEFGAKILAISILVLILACGSSIVLARMIMRPIRALHEGVTRFWQREFNLRQVNSDNELGQPASKFNNIADAFNEKHTRLITTPPNSKSGSCDGPLP